MTELSTKKTIQALADSNIPSRKMREQLADLTDPNAIGYEVTKELLEGALKIRNQIQTEKLVENLLGEKVFAGKWENQGAFSKWFSGAYGTLSKRIRRVELFDGTTVEEVVYSVESTSNSSTFTVDDILSVEDVWSRSYHPHPQIEAKGIVLQ